MLQFVITGEQGLLQHAIDQPKRIPLKEQQGSQVRSHLKSLLRRVETEKGVVELTFLQSFLLPSQKWPDKRLGDYHQNFTEANSTNKIQRLLPKRTHLMEAVKTSMQLLIESASSLMQVLNQLCDVIFEPLRDHVVTGLLQASLDGLLRVLLDGGPSQLFLPSDAKLMEEDLEVLKEFFISGGDGLPWGVVENQVTRVCQVIMLHGCETRELIDDLKSASEMVMHGCGSKLGADTKTLLRVLCHRSVNLCSTINMFDKKLKSNIYSAFYIHKMYMLYGE